MTLFDLLTQKKTLLIFSLVSVVFFIFNYQLIAKLPGGNNLMCEIGGGLTPFNITFSLVLSVMIGLLVMGLFGLFLQKKAKTAWKTGSTTTLGMVLGIFTTFCTLCTLPVLSLLGLGVSLEFMTEYNLWFKIASLLILSLSIYFLNKQLKEKCEFCVE